MSQSITDLTQTIDIQNDSPESRFSKNALELENSSAAVSRHDAYAIEGVAECSNDNDTLAVKSLAYRMLVGQWGGIHHAEGTKQGRDHLRNTYEKEVNSLLKRWSNEMRSTDSDDNVTVDKSADAPTVKFKMKSSHGILPLFKGENGDMVIWGPASVEVVDKEGDKIRASALEEALPQLLKRQRLSLEHSDQLVGEILENFETDEEVTVKIDGDEYTRSDFPTDVLELDGRDPSLYVAGRVWDDTRQSRQAQKDVSDGTLDSYSISGESIVATTKYEEGDVVNDIKELDLSAVTLCEEGMNQKSKFGVVQKAGGDARTDDGVVKSESGGRAGNNAIEVIKNMSEEPESESEQGQGQVTLDEVRAEFKSVVEETLPDSELATKEDMIKTDDVEEMIKEHAMSEDDVEEIALKTFENVIQNDDEEDNEDDVPEGDEDEEEKGDGPPPEEREQQPQGAAGEGDEEDDEEDDMPEEFKGYDHSDLQERLPEDLYEACREYLDQDDEGMVEASEGNDAPMSEEDVEKMIDEQFGDEIALDSPSGPTGDVQKSWDEEDDEDSDEVGIAAGQLY